jgi:pimeloyl-ACP methyl ester carboxylesterase
MAHAPENNQPPKFLEQPCDQGSYRLAYHKSEGKNPGFIWLGGFRSDMNGTKALALEQFAKTKDHACLRFDYRGHGQSDGDFASCTIGQWLDDAKAMLSHCTTGEQILVGSSMGGWIALLLALSFQRQNIKNASPIKALILLAPAPDFTQTLMWEQFPDEIRQTIMDKGVYHLPSAYDPIPTPITRALIEEGRKHLLLDGLLDLDCPVHIVHGVDDKDVPLDHVLKLQNAFAHNNVTLTLINDGDHRLSRPQDLDVLSKVYSNALEL